MRISEKHSIAEVIKSLLPHLPCFAEEEGDHYSVNRCDLINALCQKQHLDRTLAENTVNWCEALLDTLAVLNIDALQRGEWCFVSFPAQLMALSVLTALSDSDSRYFEPNFWNTRDVDSSKLERQREVLQFIENRRNDRHLKQQAEPVRYIHVAWSLIKHEGKVLFFHREDKTRHEKNSGNYGLIGGRVNQNDFIGFNGDSQAKLRLLQSADRTSIQPALAETLKRELLEEVGLEYEQHYLFRPWRALKPYRQVQGAKSNHALTDYFLEIFAIELTLEGFCYLQQKITEDKQLVWFSLDEMAQGRTRDGKTAFIEALYKDFDDNRERLKAALDDLDDSFKTNYLNCQDPAKYRIVLPENESQPICAGAPGKESAIDLSLDQSSLSLLLGLAAHLREFSFVEKDTSIALHPYGWLEVEDDCELQTELVELAEAFKDSKDIVIENQKDRWFRLSISPDCVFFDDSYFRCSVDQKDMQSRKSKVRVTAMRREFGTRLGTVGKDKKETKVPINVVKSLDNLNKGNRNDSLTDSVRDSYRKSQLHDCLAKLGMRGLLRQDAGAVKIYCEFVMN
ncbi:NUDIX hydrolase [Methylotuvimicrobium buryatense]|uniref:NUDIX hydrolase n=1 Tax=Methylotuvimicrobium buryatense TaxID=95641 RepID=A0A4P9UR36_METBY|nr:NUDIX hydrolase [Methylotuvimicrobium buryatense]QCW83827.1 NUDIX hydrolase [Methylotuvimicrobium buryatense]